MRIIAFAGFDNDLKKLGKKYKLNVKKFFEDLCREVIKDPTESAVIIAETESYQIVKRRVRNPRIKKGKSRGFRVWYCLRGDDVCFCLIEDAVEKAKEKDTLQHIARIRDLIKG